MSTVQLPLFTRSYKNADGIVLTDDSATQFNGFIDQLRGLNIRPGERPALNGTGRVNGLFYWPDKNKIIAVYDGGAGLFNIVEGSGVYSGSKHLEQIGSFEDVTFGAGNLVTFASDGARVFMAGGGPINYINDSGAVSEVTDSEAPTKVTHIAFLDGYILAINDSHQGDGKFYNSVVNDGTSFEALGFQTAEGSPDNNQALHVIQRQIYLLGAVSTEIWENDGQTPFSRIPGGLIEIGCIARNSPIRWGNSLVWLGHTRQIVQFTGTDVKFISGRYDKEIANFQTVHDCIGNFIQHGGQEYLVFQFPTENRTFVYNPQVDDWSEWGGWDPLTNAWQCYDLQNSARDLITGETFIGKRDAGRIAMLSSTSRFDLLAGADVRGFRFFRRTGWIDHGTSKDKRLEELRFRVKRGAIDAAGLNNLRFEEEGGD